MWLCQKNIFNSCLPKKKQCFTFRDQTEWVELIKYGYNTLVDVTNKNIEQLILKKISKKINFDKEIYGDGKTSKKIISKIQKSFLKNWKNY